MVVAWARAETALVHLYSYAMSNNFNMAMAAYYRIPSFEIRIKMIMAMLTHWNTSDYDTAAIKTAIEKLAKLARTRNKWIHGTYGMNMKKPETVIYDFRADANSPERQKTMRSADVQNHINAVHRRTRALEDLFQIHARLDLRLT